MSGYCEVCECDPCDCYDGCVPEDTKMIKYEYIHNEKRDVYYVPRAPSLCEARTRESMFMKYLGTEPYIASPMEWEILLKTFKVKYLEA
jgi:hypothetical protein